MRIRPATKEAIDLFMQGSVAYSKMEATGMLIDEPYLKKALAETAAEIKQLESELKEHPIFQIWRKRFGAKTTLGSHPQLETIIFDHCKFKRTGRKTDTGGNSSDESAFEFVDEPFVRKYFKCEKIKKARGTYLQGIERELVNSRIHPIHNLHIAVTYRPTADKPNVRNIPVRNEIMGNIVRGCYIAPPGYCILEVDLSGAEVCWGCVYHKDPVMIKYVKNPKSDMHRDIAMQIYMLERSNDKYWKEGIGKNVRYAAKNKMVFPEFYGSYFLDCAQSLWEAIDLMKLTTPEGIELKKHLKSKGIKKLGDKDSNYDSGRITTHKGTFIEHVRQVEKDMWDRRFQVYKQWKWEWWNQYVERGYFKFLTGFVGQGLMDRKQVCNAPVQGSAYHHVLWSFIQMQNWLEKKKMKSKVVNEIYDSMIIYAKISEIQDVLWKANQIMTVDALKHWPCINVPITIEAELAPEGEAWNKKKKIAIPI